MVFNLTECRRSHHAKGAAYSNSSNYAFLSPISPFTVNSAFLMIVEKSALFEFGNHPPPAIMVQMPFSRDISMYNDRRKKNQQTGFNLQQVTMENLERSYSFLCSHLFLFFSCSLMGSNIVLLTHSCLQL